MQTLHIDLETFSYLDLKQVGLYKYAQNSQILLCAFAFDDQPVGIIDLANGENFPADVLDSLFNPNVIKTSYNAPFEFQVLSHHLLHPLFIDQWQCTMVPGLSLGLPAGLYLLGNVLNLSSDNKKIAEGKKLITFFSSPFKPKDDNQISLFASTESDRHLPQFHPEKWHAFKEYCKQDVVSERAIKIYNSLHAAATSHSACNDGKAHGMFQFYGANRTGRWAGRLIQLQNLPQNHLDDLDVARLFVKNGDSVALKISFDKPADILSQLIRTAFIAPKGCRFIVADFSAIEARVIAWLADEKWRLKVFADGGDIYCASASAMFGVPVEKHGVNHELRAKGKIAELACGFGGNVAAFKAFGADKLGLSDSDIVAVIKKWRASNPNICKLWRDIETAAFSAIKSKSPTVSYKGIRFETVDDFLFIKLPSDRKLAYFKPAIVSKNGKESLTYEGNIQSSSSWGENLYLGRQAR